LSSLPFVDFDFDCDWVQKKCRTFFDELGQPCSAYAALGSCREAVGLTALGKQRVFASCGLTCNSCVKANDVCEIGSGGSQVEIPAVLSSFEIIDQEFLTSACEWSDSPAGLQQTSNAYGNVPGLNLWMGCMAMVKDVTYTDFIMELETRQLDDDAMGIIFGMDPANKVDFYQVFMNNADWFYNPTDQVQGPHLKLAKRNGLPCKAEMMTPPEMC